jgi:hypothetical protein
LFNKENKMDDDIKRILGKTIRSIVVTKRAESKPSTLIFFVFDDGTSYGFGGTISGAGGLDGGGEQSAIKAARLFNKENTHVYSLESPEREQNIQGQAPDLAKLTRALMDFGLSLSANILLPTVVPEAASIVTTDPYAFCISACLDRGTKAEII